MRDERRRLHLFAQHALVVVVDAQPALRRDDAALALDHLRREREIGNAIGFEIEDQLERVARKPVLVHRDVIAGERVVGTSLRLHQPVELARLPARGAVEHHVLEEVREAR